MIQKATAMTLRQNLGEILNRVRLKHDSVLITKAGTPVAALVDMDMFEKVRMMREELDNFTRELSHAYDGVAQEKVLQDINEAFHQARDK
jgi:prevent-host-death family protein